jgi:hypothetical protein
MNTVNEQKPLTLGRVIKAGGFKKGFYAMPHNKLLQVRGEICELCYWSLGTFRIKLAGARPFRMSEAKDIEAYFADRGVDAWTGESLKQ